MEDVNAQVINLFSVFDQCTGLANLVNVHFAIMQLRGTWGEDTAHGEIAEKAVEDDMNRKVLDLINDRDV